MLVRILEFREKLKNIYIRYDRYLLMGVRFLGTMFGLSVLLEIGTYWSPNMSLPLWMMLLVSGACALLPAGTISFVFCFVLMLQALEFSLDVFLVLGVLFLLMLLLYYSFRPHHGVLLGASLIAFFLGVPQLLCLLAGLFFTPFAAVPICFGIITGSFVELVGGSLATLGSSGGFSIENVTYLLTAEFTNSSLYVQLFAACAAVSAVYLIRRHCFQYARMAAVLSGGVVWLLVRLSGMILTRQVKIVWLEIALTVFSMLIVMAVSLFLFTEDYSRVEYLNFEDDEYYYYVKAVPKVTVTVSDTKVKKISGQVKQEETDVTKAFDSEK